MSDLSCPLCKSSDVVIKESLDTKILSNLYKKRANVEVKHIFANHSSISFCGCKSCGLLFYYPIILGDGKFYEDLQSYPGYYLEEKEDYTIACKYITASDDVLEVGCGAGFFTNFIKPKSYVGLEFNDKAIGIAKGKGLDVRKQFLQEHAQENAEKYDVVCFFQVLEHIEDPRAFITDALKCLKKGGKLILAVPAEDSHNADAVNAYLNMPPHHATRWSDATLKNIASLFNIELVDIIHENIQPIHEEFYIKVKDFKKVRQIFGMPQKQLTSSFLDNLLYILIVALSKVKKIFKNFENIRGNSVVAIYKK
jgi:2-polyprenyl-3-methyl-5-hydroxy-6-metoxy-1,4-benzoquinol methylase